MTLAKCQTLNSGCKVYTHTAAEGLTAVGGCWCCCGGGGGGGGSGGSGRWLVLLLSRRYSYRHPAHQLHNYEADDVDLSLAGSYDTRFAVRTDDEMMMMMMAASAAADSIVPVRSVRPAVRPSLHPIKRGSRCIIAVALLVANALHDLCRRDFLAAVDCESTSNCITEMHTDGRANFRASESTGEKEGNRDGRRIARGTMSARQGRGHRPPYRRYCYGVGAHKKWWAYRMVCILYGKCTEWLAYLMVIYASKILLYWSI